MARLNPSTGIVDLQKEEVPKEERVSTINKRLLSASKGTLSPLGVLKQQVKNKQEVSTFNKLRPSTAIGKLKQEVLLTPKYPSTKSKKDLSIKRRLETQRLKNLIQKEKLKNQLAKLKEKNKFMLPAQQILQQTSLQVQPMMQYPLYPSYASQEVMDDLDQTFNADIGHSDGNIFGYEQYYGENYYDEDFFGTEFNQDPFEQLSIKINRNTSPLLW